MGVVFRLEKHTGPIVAMDYQIPGCVDVLAVVFFSRPEHVVGVHDVGELFLSDQAGALGARLLEGMAQGIHGPAGTAAFRQDQQRGIQGGGDLGGDDHGRAFCGHAAIRPGRSYRWPGRMGDQLS